MRGWLCSAVVGGRAGRAAFSAVMGGIYDRRTCGVRSSSTAVLVDRVDGGAVGRVAGPAADAVQALAVQGAHAVEQRAAPGAGDAGRARGGALQAGGAGGRGRAECMRGRPCGGYAPTPLVSSHVSSHGHHSPPSASPPSPGCSIGGTAHWRNTCWRQCWCWTHTASRRVGWRQVRHTHPHRPLTGCQPRAQPTSRLVGGSERPPIQAAGALEVCRGRGGAEWRVWSPGSPAGRQRASP